MVDSIEQERQALDPKLRALLEDDATTDKNNLLFCVQCSTAIGRTSDAIDVNGAHQHFCTNPHGIDFDVCCYSQALGCNISGQPTGADSWFPGYTWRFATCSGCNVHLGWLFERAAGQDHFYGLVRERIQTESGIDT